MINTGASKTVGLDDRIKGIYFTGRTINTVQINRKALSLLQYLDINFSITMGSKNKLEIGFYTIV
jgi:hypothetical protein